MKYLKKFENIEISEAEKKHLLDQIKFVFFDLVDDFDMEEIPEDLNEQDDTRPGLYYHLYQSWVDLKRSKVGFELVIYIFDRLRQNIFHEKFLKLHERLPELQNQLESMGFKVHYHELSEDEIRDDLAFIDELDIHISYNLAQ
jgi:hypothetical protein